MTDSIWVLLAVMTIVAIGTYPVAMQSRARARRRARRSLPVLDARLACDRRPHAVHGGNTDLSDTQGEMSLLMARIRAARDGMHGFTEALFERQFFE